MTTFGGEDYSDDEDDQDEDDKDDDDANGDNWGGHYAMAHADEDEDEDEDDEDDKNWDMSGPPASTVPQTGPISASAANYHRWKADSSAGTTYTSSRNNKAFNPSATSPRNPHRRSQLPCRAILRLCWDPNALQLISNQCFAQQIRRDSFPDGPLHNKIDFVIVESDVEAAISQLNHSPKSSKREPTAAYLYDQYLSS